jgi:hypothetical protein
MADGGLEEDDDLLVSVHGKPHGRDMHMLACLHVCMLDDGCLPCPAPKNNEEDTALH